jgi:undecaprenyl pyrophosphate phosphatase UppP
MQVIGNVSDEYIKNVTAGLIAGFISLLIYGFFEHVLFNPKIIVYFWLTIGFILMNYKYYKKNRGLL